MRWSLSNNIPLNRKDLTDLRGTHIDVEVTTSLYIRLSELRMSHLMKPKTLRTYKASTQVLYVPEIAFSSPAYGCQANTFFAIVTLKPYTTSLLTAPLFMRNEFFITLHLKKVCNDHFTLTVF